MCLCVSAWDKCVCVCWVCKRFWNPAAETVAVVAAASARLKCNKATDDWQSARLPPLLKWDRLLGFLSLSLSLCRCRLTVLAIQKADGLLLLLLLLLYNAQNCTELCSTVYSFTRISLSLSLRDTRSCGKHTVSSSVWTQTHTTLLLEKCEALVECSPWIWRPLEKGAHTSSLHWENFYINVDEKKLLLLLKSENKNIQMRPKLLKLKALQLN